ncbi:MAG TPA: hypothetical protein VJ770_26390 [Stellaceae bacterium]|nr:hypothetical protein [Stellaceae bacterium]
MIFPLAPPVSVLKWGIVVWLITDIDDIPQKVGIRVLIPPDKTQIAALETTSPLGAEYTEGATKNNWRAVMVLPPATFTEEGYVEVMVDTEQGTIRAGRLFVKFTTQQADTSSNASSVRDNIQSPLQSRPDVQDSSSRLASSRRGSRVRRQRS